MQTVVVATLAGIAVAEILIQSRADLYTRDEIVNLDAAITFLRTGNYTTRYGFPFDPAISSGLLATWMDALVFLIGGNLYQARAARAVAHLAITVVLLFVFLRHSGLRRFLAAVVSLLLWLAVVLIPHHSIRIVSPGEIWGLLYLIAGVFFVRSCPLAAATLWGVATWLCKMIYLPFALALLAAQIFATRSEQHIDFRSRRFVDLCCTHTAAFLAPLVVWMSIIWLRYDLDTLLRWCFSYLAFVFTHATGVEVDLPGLAGWRFAPGWPEAKSLLRYERDITLPFLLPLAAGPMLLVLHAGFRAVGVLRSTLRERYFLRATAAAIGVFSLWFFALDPTQWGRHLMSAVYVSIALAIYCLADIWKQRALPPAGYALAVAGLSVFIVYQSVSNIVDDYHSTGWKMSYASTCHGVDFVHPPCSQDKARQFFAAECDEHMTCIQERRERFLQRARTLAAGAHTTGNEPYTAGFVVVFIQHNCYSDRQEFEKDFRPILCAATNANFRSYLEEAGLDTASMLRKCEPLDSSR